MGGWYDTGRSGSQLLAGALMPRPLSACCPGCMQFAAPPEAEICPPEIRDNAPTLGTAAMLCGWLLTCGDTFPHMMPLTGAAACSCCEVCKTYDDAGAHTMSYTMPVTGADACCRCKAPTAWPAAADRNDVIGELCPGPAVPPVIWLRGLGVHSSPRSALSLYRVAWAPFLIPKCHFTAYMGPLVPPF